ncbi:MAG: YjiH family protein, partial [Paraclostridium sp.]
MDQSNNTITNDIKYDSNMSSKELDSVNLNSTQYKQGIGKCILFTVIAVFVFFVPVTVNGKSDVPFGFIYNFFIDLFGNFGLWLVSILMIGNFFANIYGKYRTKTNEKLKEYYSEDSVFHTILYFLGAVYTTVYAMHVTIDGFVGPEFIVGSSTGGTVIPSVVLGVMWIIPVGAFFMPFLLNYGAIEFIGALLEPLMRPIFKVPGKSALNAVASFVSSSSLGVLITDRLYKQNVYTKKETVAIATSFSAVSVGFAFLVINTAGLGDHFIKVYFSALLISFIVAIFMVRIPPISKKADEYYDGTIQTEEDRKSDVKFTKGLARTGVDRAFKKAYIANNIFVEIKNSILDSLTVVPKVLSLLAAVGISALILAEFTPIFNYLGLIFEPILNILQVPNASDIAPSVPVGIAEMFLPVLLIADKVEMIDIGARYFITALSMVQIIFFSETVV